MGDNFDAISKTGDEPKIKRVCCKCGGNADIPQPVKNMYPKLGGGIGNQRYIHHPGGNMNCWDCYGGNV